jgi:hypothetical protein
MVLSTTISLRMQAMMAHWAICPGLQMLIDLLGDAIGLGFKEMQQALDNPEGYYLAKGDTYGLRAPVATSSVAARWPSGENSGSRSLRWGGDDSCQGQEVGRRLMMAASSGPARPIPGCWQRSCSVDKYSLTLSHEKYSSGGSRPVGF